MWSVTILIPLAMEQKIRVFISFSSKDEALVKKLVEVLGQNGISVLWRHNLRTGNIFNDELKIFIEHAHVFMPVLTKSSSSRGWVHQEIGYAMGLHIPVFPVTTENIKPGEMLSQLQATKLSEDPEILSKQLDIAEFKDLIESKKKPALFQCAARVGDRARLLKSYSDNVGLMKKTGIVRQRGGLSSFHIPDEWIEDRVWEDRYYPGSRDLEHRELQQRERLALQKHADQAGCRLIINPEYAVKGKSKLAAATRMNSLIRFLESREDSKAIVAIQDGETSIESLTMLGDWFMAESVSFKPGDGFTNTFFTRNASEINMRIEEFEKEMNYLLSNAGWDEKDSRKKAIEYLKLRLEEIVK